jgi:hypothetical protein
MRLFISPLYEAMKTINEKGDYMKFDQEFSIGVSGQVRGGGMLKRVFCPLQFVYMRTMVYIVYDCCKQVKILQKERYMSDNRYMCSQEEVRVEFGNNLCIIMENLFNRITICRNQRNRSRTYPIQKSFFGSS